MIPVGILVSTTVYLTIVNVDGIRNPTKNLISLSLFEPDQLKRPKCSALSSFDLISLTVTK